jgi:hypothetical protein
MCLTCAFGQMSKKDKKELFKYSKHKTYLHTQDNRCIQLSEVQIDEIIEHALYVMATGVDLSCDILSCDIWAIQWDNDYKVKTINLADLKVT